MTTREELVAALSTPSDAVNESAEARLREGIEVRLQDDAIDEVVARDCDLHIEQLSDYDWFVGVTAANGDYAQFNISTKSRRSHITMIQTDSVLALSSGGDEAKKSAPVRAPSLPSGESDLSVTTGCAGAGTGPSADRREIVARIIDPDAYNGSAGHRDMYARRATAITKADRILVQDEAAIRADEREQCAIVAETCTVKRHWQPEIAAAIRDRLAEQECEVEARKECARRGIDPDEICADGGVTAWMVVDQERKNGLRLSDAVNRLVAAGYLREDAEDIASEQCPKCGGDCSDANPPIYDCPMVGCNKDF